MSESQSRQMTEAEYKALQEQFWNFKTDTFRASDRAAVDIGIAALNTITLLNGGAIIALLAFTSQVLISGKDAAFIKALIGAGQPFAIGIAASTVAFFMAYFYQSTVTFGAVRDLTTHYASAAEQKRKRNLPKVLEHIFRVLMMFSAFLASVCFLLGAWRVAHIFGNLT